MSISGCKGERLSTADAINRGLTPDEEWSEQRVKTEGYKSLDGSGVELFSINQARWIKEHILSLPAHGNMNSLEAFKRWSLYRSGLTLEEIAGDRGVLVNAVANSISSFTSHLARSLSPDFLEDLPEPTDEELDAIEAEIEEETHS